MKNVIQIKKEPAVMTQEKLATLLLGFKRIYRKSHTMDKKCYCEIRNLRRQIALNSGDKFFSHKRQKLQARIDSYQKILDDGRQTKHKVQTWIYDCIQAFDRYGAASANVYAALLGTSHIHVERALAEGAEGLMHLVIYKVEDSANRSDWVSDDAILHHAITEVIIREIMQNKQLQDFGGKLIQEMAQEKLGRPLQQYQVTNLPTGKVVVQSLPPKLTLV